MEVGEEVNIWAGYLRGEWVRDVIFFPLLLMHIVPQRFKEPEATCREKNPVDFLVPSTSKITHSDGQVLEAKYHLYFKAITETSSPESNIPSNLLLIILRVNTWFSSLSITEISKKISRNISICTSEIPFSYAFWLVRHNLRK